MSCRRVAVTGMGMVTPLGIGVEKNWGAVLAGESGVGAITRFDASRLPSRIAGEVKVSGRRTSSSRMIWTE